MLVMTDAIEICLTENEAIEERKSDHVFYTLKPDIPRQLVAVKQSNIKIINVSLIKTQQNTKDENMECYTNEKLVLKKYQIRFLDNFPYFYTRKYVPFYTEFRIHKINNFANLQWPLKIYVYYKNINI